MRGMTAGAPSDFLGLEAFEKQMDDAFQAYKAQAAAAWSKYLETGERPDSVSLDLARREAEYAMLALHRVGMYRVIQKAKGGDR